MQIKLFFLVGTFSVAIASIHAQQVKRKGVDLNEVSENLHGKRVQGPVFSIEQLNGKWQEVGRTDTKKKSVDVTDTIFLNFTMPNKVTTRDGTHANMVGEAYIDRPGNVLVAAADVYTILSATKDKIVLDDQDKFIHTFSKTDSFSFERYGNLSVKQDEYKNPVAAKPDDIKANWSVYRKQAKPGAIDGATNIIRFLKVTSTTSDTTAVGEIIFYQAEKSELLPCKIIIAGTRLTIIAADKIWNLFVYKANKKEFVFGEAETLLYYAKPI